MGIPAGGRSGGGRGGKAPIGRRLAYEYQQSIEVLYGPARRREEGQGWVGTVDRGEREAGLAGSPGQVRKFSFEDTLSVPKLKVTNHQLMTFRFLVFSDMVVLDDIQGISGRPLSGMLGTIFKVIGEGNAGTPDTASRPMDGRCCEPATKVISKTVTATINPDGTGGNGVPEDRADMVAMEDRLEQPLELEYLPFRCWEAAD